MRGIARYPSVVSLLVEPAAGAAVVICGRAIGEIKCSSRKQKQNKKNSEKGIRDRKENKKKCHHWFLMPLNLFRAAGTHIHMIKKKDKEKEKRRTGVEPRCSSWRSRMEMEEEWKGNKTCHDGPLDKSAPLALSYSIYSRISCFHLAPNKTINEIEREREKWPRSLNNFHGTLDRRHWSVYCSCLSVWFFFMTERYFKLFNILAYSPTRSSLICISIFDRTSGGKTGIA